ncbi:hypothetical protein ACOMHN_028966 [Nucella lapillus]
MTGGGLREEADTGVVLEPSKPVPDCAHTSPSPGVASPVPDCALTSPSPGVPPPVPDCAITSPSPGVAPPVPDCALTSPSPGVPRPVPDCAITSPSPGVAPPVPDCALTSPSPGVPPPVPDCALTSPSPGVPPPGRLGAADLSDSAPHVDETRPCVREPGERVDVGPCAAGDNVCGERDSQDGCRADKSPVASDNPLHHEKEMQEALYTWKRAQELADNLWQDYQWAVERCAFEVEDAKRGPGVENHRPGCFSARTSWIPETWKAAKEHVSILQQNYEGFERGLGRSKPDKDDGSSSSFGLSEMSQDEKPEKENGHCDVEHSKPVCDDPSSSPVTIRKTELSDKERVWSGCGGDSDAHQGVSARTLWTPQLWKEAKNNVDIFQRNYQGFESAAREPQTPLCASQRGQQNRGANFDRIISLISHSSINAENLFWKREDGCTLGAGGAGRRSPIPDRVVVLLFTYDQNTLGLFLASAATVASRFLFAFLHSLLALFLALRMPSTSVLYSDVGEKQLTKRQEAQAWSKAATGSYPDL